MPAAKLFTKNSFAQIPGGLDEIGGAAEVAPIIFIGAEGKDFFPLSSETQIGSDDGEDAFFGDHRQ